MNSTQFGQLKRWLLVGVKILVVGLVIFFIRHALVEAFRQLEERPWQCDYRWLFIAGLLYLLGTALSGVFWHYTLRALGQKVGFWRTIRAYFIGHLGKYVPGKAMVVVIRAGLVQNGEVDTSLAAASVFFETLTMMSVGAFIAAAIVAGWFREQALLFWASLGMMAMAGLPTFPPIFRRIVRFVGVGRKDPSVIEKLSKLGYRAMFVGWGLTAIGWGILGLSYWATLKSLGATGSNPLELFHICTAAVTLSMVAGFVSFVPGGGLGVREAVLMGLVAPQMGDAVALLSAVLWRLIGVVSELVISGILFFIARR